MKSLPDEVDHAVRKFGVDIETLRQISEGLVKENGSSIAMLPSFVPALPDGTESGKFVSIDLSGKNLRIMLLTICGNGQEPQTVNTNFTVPNHVMKGTGDQLFTFIVNCLQRFLQEFDLVDANLPIGFGFFKARLLWWTKGFDIKDCLQKDVVALLEEALEMNMSTKAQIKAVMNDTVGQLAAAAYKFGDLCTIGVVIGYGCNSSYLEKTENIKKFDPVASEYNHDKMVVVTEWEEFGSNGELEHILTPFDKEIDAASVHQGQQIIDKLTGALYLGELVRRVLAQFCLDGYLFDGQQCEKLDIPDTFPTKFILEILADEDGFRACRRVCDDLEVPSHGSTDYNIIYAVAHAVSERSAAIVASAIAALLRLLGQKCIRIGVGGALIQFSKKYYTMLEEHLRILAPPDCQWELVAADEGSAKGAAMIAAVAEKYGL